MSGNRREALVWYVCGALILGAAAYSLAVLAPGLVAALFQFAAGITAVRCFRAAGGCGVRNDRGRPVNGAGAESLK